MTTRARIKIVKPVPVEARHGLACGVILDAHIDDSWIRSGRGQRFAWVKAPGSGEKVKLWAHEFEEV